MKKLLTVVGIVLSIALCACNATLEPLPANENASDGSSFGTSSYQTSDVPASVDVLAEKPFSGLDASDVVAVRGTHPYVFSQDLSDEDSEALVAALASVVARTPSGDLTNEWGNPSFPVVYTGGDGMLWFELDFATGEHWLLKVRSTYQGNGHHGVICIGEYEVGITEDVYLALAGIYADFEEAARELPAEFIHPFDGLTVGDTACAECLSGTTWEELDEDTTQELVSLLNQVRINRTSGTNEIPVLYGGGEPFNQFRLTFTDGSTCVIGGGYDTYIDGIRYSVCDACREIDALYNSVAVSVR